jgi:hypothetical protein
MVGISGYAGEQWRAAAQGHPALKAIFPYDACTAYGGMFGSFIHCWRNDGASNPVARPVASNLRCAPGTQGLQWVKFRSARHTLKSAGRWLP